MRVKLKSLWDENNRYIRIWSICDEQENCLAYGFPSRVDARNWAIENEHEIK